MSEEMIPIPFEKMLNNLIQEYKEKKSFFGVPVYQGKSEAPIGLAAGPHTQLAGNILAGYAAGGNYFELKTVQVLQGEALGIIKPCIDVAYEVYNTEWSTELKISEARDEYIKAYLLIAVLSKMFHLKPIEQIHFIASVGYDLKGIQSECVDDFLESMKHAKIASEWQKDIAYIKLHRGKEIEISKEDLEKIEAMDVITDTVTLSTMHGCKKSEIKDIATYLMKEKGMNTFIKLNPTLIGKERISQLLESKGYHHIEVVEDIFKIDMTLDMATSLIKELRQIGKQLGKTFGIKLTNTLPVKNKEGGLKGETKYLSGVPLYPIAIEAAYKLLENLKEDMPVSYSGGIDITNIKEVLEAGIAPVTVSSYILKPRGYSNLTKLMEVSQGYKETALNIEALKELAKDAAINKTYDYKKVRTFEPKEGYTSYCGKCYNCVDICPNRANIAGEFSGVNEKAAKRRYVIHLDALCNECGSCKCECIMGHSPYQDKFTIYTDEESFRLSEGDGAFYDGESLLIKEGSTMAIPKEELIKLVKSRL